MAGKTTTEEKETEVEVEEVKAPVTRFFSVALELVLKSDNENITAEEVEKACKDQIVLPVSVWTGGNINVNVVGAVSGGVSEQSAEVEINGGYGREEPPEKEEE